MIRTFFATLPHLATLGICLLLSAHLHAQTTSARGTTGRNTTARSTQTGSTGSQSGTTGPRQYRSNTVLGDATVQVDPETRSLVIITDEATHSEMMKVITELDKPKPQVLIKVLFLEVTYNDSLDVGIEGNYTFNVGNGITSTVADGTQSTSTSNTVTTTTGSTSSASSTSSPLMTTAATGLGVAGTSFGLSQLTDGSFVRIVTDEWSATLRALAQKGKLEVLSRPSILARNNQEAIIIVGQEVPFITNSRITSDGQTINTVQYEDVGIILRVTPFITSEGTVEMIVAPEISTLTDQTVAISDTVSSPIIAKRSAETVVVTPDATTVVIGGLMETQRIESVQKIPLLGDIPLLGAAFRRTVKSDTKRELLIFLTPYIVYTPETLKNVTLNEANRAELAREAFTPEEVEKYLDTLAILPDEDKFPEVRRAIPVKGKR